jgi:hypothetical protein
MSSLPDMLLGQKRSSTGTKAAATLKAPDANLKRPIKEVYTAPEAAAALGVTRARLHRLLDQHIFSGGTSRPGELQFTP